MISVEIICTNEIQSSKWLWAVQFTGTDYWLNAFETESEAMEYCKSNEYNVSTK